MLTPALLQRLLRLGGLAVLRGAARGLIGGGGALLLVMGSGCALIQPGAPAAPGNAPATAPATAPVTAPATGSQIRLQIDVPDPLRPVLEKGLDLSRLQSLRGDETIDDNEWSRLIGAAPAQARTLLQTEGYFDAQVSVQRGPAVPPPAGTPASAPSARVVPVQISVQPGPRTQVATLAVETTGDLQRRASAGEADAVALRGTLPAAAPLQPGQPFRNPAWSDSKQLLLARLRAAGYASASLEDSLADIDAPAQLAHLKVVLASGPLYLAGPVQVEGLKHHDEITVRNLAGFGPGTPLSETRLLDWQDRLQKAGLFESASVGFDPDPALAAAAPVRVRLVEQPLQQATIGAGVSANTGPRATLEHTHRRAFGLPVIARNKLEWGRDAQSWTGDYQTHPGEGFYRNLLGVQIDRLRSDTDLVLSQRLRLGRTQDTPRIERLYFAEWLRSKQTDTVASSTGASVTASAVSVNYHWVWRDLDSVLLPTRGSTWSLQAGVGQAGSEGGPTGPFSRWYGRATGYLPIGSWYGQARLEAGQIVKSDKVTVPDALGFRAGGDDSVRGYAYRSLAPTAADGTVTSGLSLLTGSVELAHPILARLPAVWGAVFVDAGRAVNQWGDYRAALGYGAGVRWRSPIGPLKVDLAYGEELRKVRLHFSVGIAF